MLNVNKVSTRVSGQLFDWSFSLKESGFLAVVGASGVGKSTLLRSLIGLQENVTGEIQWNGVDNLQKPVSDRPFGMLFQTNNVFEHLSVETNLALGLNPSAKLTEDEHEQLLVSARRFQIESLLTKKADQLSGGQEQRVALARVFLQNKPILLLDEPFSSLDPALRHEGLQWVTDMQQKHGTTIIMVTHHLSEIEKHADSVFEGIGSDNWKQYPAFK